MVCLGNLCLDTLHKGDDDDDDDDDDNNNNVFLVVSNKNIFFGRAEVRILFKLHSS
jgi:hypothetical protein